MDDRKVTYTRVRDGKTQTVTRLKRAHGQSKTPLYRLWKAMNRRCESEVAHNYQWYGAKGVYVCTTWREDFLAFKAWAEGHGYARGLELDRLDSDGPYSPENCRWKTKKANIRDRDLYWSDELDIRVVQFASQHGLNPYELIETAVTSYLDAREGVR